MPALRIRDAVCEKQFLVPTNVFEALLKGERIAILCDPVVLDDGRLAPLDWVHMVPDGVPHAMVPTMIWQVISLFKGPIQDLPPNQLELLGYKNHDPLKEDDALWGNFSWADNPEGLMVVLHPFNRFWMTVPRLWVYGPETPQIEDTMSGESDDEPSGVESEGEAKEEG